MLFLPYRRMYGRKRSRSAKGFRKGKTRIKGLILNRPLQDIPLNEDGTPLTHPRATLARRVGLGHTLSQKRSEGLGLLAQTGSTQSSSTLKASNPAQQHQASASSTAGTVSMIPVSHQAQYNQWGTHSSSGFTPTTEFSGAKSK